MTFKAEYIWIDGTEPTAKLRSKTKIIVGGGAALGELPIWGFDGSSTNQAKGHASDRVLKPVFVCPDPIRGGDDVLVLCEVLNTDMTPHESNTRAALAEVAAKYAAQEPIFGIEQEYTFFEGTRPLGFPVNGFPAAQGGYYCGVGADEIDLGAGAFAGGAEVLGGQDETPDTGALEGERVQDPEDDDPKVVGVGGRLREGAGAVDGGAVGEPYGQGHRAGDLVAAADPLAEGDGQVQERGPHEDRVAHVPVERVVGARGLRHAVGCDRSGVDTAGTVAQDPPVPPAEHPAHDTGVHRGERADRVQAEGLQPGRLRRADAVQRTDRERGEELLDGPVVGQVQDAGAAHVGGGGRGGGPGVGDPDAGVDAVLGERLDPEACRQPPGRRAEQPPRAPQLREPGPGRKRLDERGEVAQEVQDPAVAVRGGVGAAPHVPDHVVVAAAHAAASPRARWASRTWRRRSARPAAGRGRAQYGWK